MFTLIPNLKRHYDSDEDNIPEEFFIPILSSAKIYKRVVGYFDSNFFFGTRDGVLKFIENKGKIEYVLCHEITESEYKVIQQGYATKEVEKKILDSYSNNLELIKDKLSNNNKEATALLIESNFLDIKIGYRPPWAGIVHHKLLLATDNENNKVVTHGSGNATGAAILRNADSFTVERSWKKNQLSDLDFWEKLIQRFFNNEVKNTIVYDFSEASKKKLIQITKSKIGGGQTIGIKTKKVPRIPSTFKGKPFNFKEHQINALEAWKKENGQCILAMATGAGKTVTAAYGIVRLFEGLSSMNLSLFVIVVVPLNNLGHQWQEELEVFNIESLKCFDSANKWKETLSSKITEFNIDQSNKKPNFLCIITNNQTLKGDTFQGAIQSINRDSMLLVGDECHHHNTELSLQKLPKTKYRIGLSATPFHDWNEEKNDRIKQFYNKVGFEYPIQQAIKDGILTPYRYIALKVYPTDEELSELLDIQKDISKAYAILKNNPNNQQADQNLKSLMGRKIILLGTLQNKLNVLKENLEDKKPENYTLFYVSGDYQSESFKPAITKTQQILNKIGWKTSKFTGEESKPDREVILENFKNSVVNGMVAIKCLDEGVDIPACKTAFILASSKASREFIQRRGRVLRQCPEIGKEEAVIYDFVTIIPKIQSTQGFGREIQKEEFKRVYEFRRFSNNEWDAYNELITDAKIWEVEDFL